MENVAATDVVGNSRVFANWLVRLLSTVHENFGAKGIKVPDLELAELQQYINTEINTRTRGNNQIEILEGVLLESCAISVGDDLLIKVDFKTKAGTRLYKLPNLEGEVTYLGFFNGEDLWYSENKICVRRSNNPDHDQFYSVDPNVDAVGIAAEAKRRLFMLGVFK